ncbi:hypothetical protein BH11ACT3_BH11ACT3_01310 [soil metagenome]
MKKSLGVILATAATTAALVFAGGVSAMAAPSTATDDGPTVGPHSSLSAIQKAAAVAIAKRIASLNGAIARVDANEHLTDDDRATILATLNADVDAMNDLADEIAADTKVAEAADDYQSIFEDYRVYAVALPQSLYAAGGDALTGSAIPKLNDAYDKLEAALDGAHADDSTPELEAKLADMKQKIADATAASDGLASDALAVSPADWNADHTVLTDIRGQLRDAVADAKDAAQDGRDIAAALK